MISEIEKCPKCGGERQKRFLRVGGGGNLIQLSDSESVWKMGKRDKIVALLCQKCGYVEFYLDMRIKKDREQQRSRGLVR